MNRTLYLIPPIVNQGEASEEALVGFDPFQEKSSALEQFFYGREAAIAPTLALNQASHSPENAWACAQLVHIHATRDHLVLTDPSILNIDPSEEIALKASVQYLLDELAPNGTVSFNNHWIFPANSFETLRTHSPAQAIGRNIDVWMPTDTNIQGIAKKWRQIQNEIQMIWHDHHVNQSRVNRGELPINSIWLYGIGSLSQVQPHSLLKNIKRIASDQALIETLANFLNKKYSNLDELGNPNELLIDASKLDVRLSQQWSQIWNASLEAIHGNNIDTLALLNPIGHSVMQLELTKKDLIPTLLNKLFFRHKLQAIQYPDYKSVIANPTKWKAIS